MRRFRRWLRSLSKTKKILRLFRLFKADTEHPDPEPCNDDSRRARNTKVPHVQSKTKKILRLFMADTEHPDPEPGNEDSGRARNTKAPRVQSKPKKRKPGGKILRLFKADTEHPDPEPINEDSGRARNTKAPHVQSKPEKRKPSDKILHSKADTEHPAPEPVNEDSGRARNTTVPHVQSKPKKKKPSGKIHHSKADTEHPAPELVKKDPKPLKAERNTSELPEQLHDHHGITKDSDLSKDVSKPSHVTPKDKRNDTDSKIAVGKYPYQPLQSNKHIIRVLHIEPPTSPSSQSGQVIAGSVFQVELMSDNSSSHAYSAVSYEWGLPPKDESKSTTILLGGHTVRVRENLYNALRRIRDVHFKINSNAESPLLLWVDAVCINQDDDVEKGHQVQMMGQIYATARTVFVWLGSGSERTLAAMNAINAIGMENLKALEENLKKKNTHMLDVETSFESLEGSGLTRHEEDFDKQLVAKLPTEQQEWANKLRDVSKGIAEFCEASYWRRVWIVQEFVMARDYLLLCNDAVVTKDEFEKVLDIVAVVRRIRGLYQTLRELDAMWPSDAGGVHLALEIPAHDLHRLKEAAKLGKAKTPLSKWLDMCAAKKFKATDPRDYVYAFLGISDDCAGKIVPDYTKSTWEVYTGTMKFAMENDPGLGEQFDTGVAGMMKLI
ncbi:hypothetical protein N0V85_006692 [Neurospora sp. IMI 360204]|nr:hypothetical protein N0V85_006692 [Neurospora sp. IMI 360204]